MFERGVEKGGGSEGCQPGEKKSDFQIFSAQNDLFQLKWQQNMEYMYIFIFFANKGGYPPLWCWVEGSGPPQTPPPPPDGNPE